MEKEVFKLLEELDIKYTIVNHPAVFTVKEACKLVPKTDGLGCKNLFLEDDKKNFYIYVLPEKDMANFDYLSNILNISKIRFASEIDLYIKTKLHRGSVTPLGILNNDDKDVTVILDQKLTGKKILIHPNVNTQTLSMEFVDLLKIIDYNKNKYKIV